MCYKGSKMSKTGSYLNEPQNSRKLKDQQLDTLNTSKS